MSRLAAELWPLQDLKSTLDPNLRCTFGDPDHQNESFRADAEDPRWEVHRIRRFDRGLPKAELQLRWPAGPKRPTGLLGDAIGAALRSAGLCEDEQQVLSIGATARYRGGGMVTRQESTWRAVEILQELVGEAAYEAAGRSSLLVALQVPAPQVAAFMSALPGNTRIFPGHQWSSVDTRGVHTSDALLSRYPAGIRRTWRRDKAAWSRTGFEVQVIDWDEALISEAAPLVAHVSLKNGTPSDERLVPWQLAGWRRHTSGSHLIAVVRDEEKLLGACFLRLGKCAVDAYEIGLVASHPHRQEIYTELVIHTPIRIALEAGVERVDLGVGHPSPKQRRGAEATPQWNIIHAPPGADISFT